LSRDAPYDGDEVGGGSSGVRVDTVDTVKEAGDSVDQGRRIVKNCWPLRKAGSRVAAGWLSFSASL